MTFTLYFPGAEKTLSVWYNNPPFRMHHFVRRPMELELSKEHDGFNEELLKLFITCRSDGSYFIEVITSNSH
jgi:3-methylcrotonyl-CoA carboxylase alpha subunit